METDPFSGLKVLVDALGALLVPVVLFFLGQWYIRSKERSESARKDAQQLEAFLEHLSDENTERRKLALLALAHLRNAGLFPASLLQSVESISTNGDPEIAAAAQMALGNANEKNNLSTDERTLLFELLLPMKIHFERSKNAFSEWVKTPPTSPNIEIEDMIKNSNSTINNLLSKKWYLIPAELQKDALKLIEHYEAWSTEYNRLRPGGLRVQDVPYVFVGPKGFPFPVDAERRFLGKYSELTRE